MTNDFLHSYYLFIFILFFVFTAKKQIDQSTQKKKLHSFYFFVRLIFSCLIFSRAF